MGARQARLPPPPPSVLTSLATDHESVEVLIQHQAVSQIEVVFERWLRMILRSQVRALRAALLPVPLTVIEGILNEAKAR